MKLVTYAKGDLPILGCLSAEVAIANQDVKVPALFYIVKAGSPLLGLDLIKALNISIIDGKVSLTKDNANPPATNTQHLRFCNIAPAHHLGCVKGFIHKVQVDTTVQPVRRMYAGRSQLSSSAYSKQAS